MEHQHSAIKVLLTEEEPLTLPHFDDETTLQSARPVVPLHEVKEAAHFRRRLLLGGALCLAAVIGAITASIIYDQRAQSAPAPATATATSPNPAQSSEFVAPSSEATGALIDTAAAVEPGSEATAVNQTDEGNEVGKGQSSVRSRTQISSASKQPARIVRQPEVQEPREQEQDVLTEQEMWDRRREARRLRRERRVNDRRNSDELSRIREIFEGAPRP